MRAAPGASKWQLGASGHYLRKLEFASDGGGGGGALAGQQLKTPRNESLNSLGRPLTTRAIHIGSLANGNAEMSSCCKIFFKNDCATFKRKQLARHSPIGH